MKKILLIVMLLGLLFTSLGYSLPLVGGNYNGLFFKNAEVLINKTGGDVNMIEPGDIFWGVLDMNNITNAYDDPSGQTGVDIWPYVPPMEITGYFLTEVKQVLSSQLGNMIIFGAANNDPNGIFSSTDLGLGAVIKIYSDDNNNYNTFKQGVALSTATDGTEEWMLSITNGYWYSFAPAIIPETGDVGVSYAGLNFINPDPSQFLKINDPNESFMDLDVNMYLSSEIFRLSGNSNLAVGPDEKMHFGSNDPAVIKPIPEPGTMMLLGFGLLGLAGVSRRRNRK